MPMTEREKDRDFFYQRDPLVRSCTVPRVILLAPGGDFPLVSYQGTDWYGLPGGKMKAHEAEAAGEGNFLHRGAFPTLSREVEEECGLDVSAFLRVSGCLGLAEVGEVDSLAKEVIIFDTPIFVCLVPSLEGVKKGVLIVNIKSHLPGPLFPDARMGIDRLRAVIGTRDRGPIHPEFLNKGGICYVQVRPQLKPLMGPPDWIR